MALLRFSRIGALYTRAWIRGFHAASVHRPYSLVLFLAFVFAGCNQASTSTPVPTDTSLLRGIVSTYRVATSSLGHPPQNVDEFTTVLTPLLENPSEHLRSMRDGEDFVIIWGLDLQTAPADLVVAYERSGVDGKRMVVTANAIVTEVSAEEFSNLNFPKDHQPAI